MKIYEKYVEIYEKVQNYRWAVSLWEFYMSFLFVFLKPFGCYTDSTLNGRIFPSK